MRRLPPLPRGYTRFLLGARAMVLNPSQVIIDILFVGR